MQTIEAKINGKVKASWDVPSRPEEVKYRQRIMFIHAYNELTDNPGKSGLEMLKAYTKVIRAFFDMEIEEVLKMPVAVHSDFEKQMTGLFLYILGVMRRYVPRLRTKAGEDYYFTYKGEQWILPWALNASEVEMTYGQAIELLEIERKAEADRQGRTDHDNIQYSSDLYKLSMMVKKPGEELPTSEVAISRMLKGRAEHFMEIDMVTMMDCLFFLTPGWNKSTKGRISNGFGILQLQSPKIPKTWKAMINDAAQGN